MVNFNESGSVESIRRILNEAIEYDVAGNKEQASQKYLVAYKILKKLAQEEKGEKRSKREYQCEAVLRAYRKAGGTEDIIKETGTEVYAENYLQSIGIETPTIPAIKFEDVAGLDDVKKEIMAKLILPMKYKELSQDYGIVFGGGLLLYGPPGTGKTHIVKAIANEVNAKFIYVNPSVIYSEWFGKFEKNISLIFKAARMLRHTIIFFDEIDTLAPKRDISDGEVVKRGVTQLLTELNGIDSAPESNVYVIAATNNPWNIDEALLRSGRFETKVYVGPPALEAREKIFRIAFRNIRVRVNIDYVSLAAKTEGYSGADIDYICKRAKQNIFMRAVETGQKIVVTTEDVLSVVTQIKPTINDKMLKRYATFSEQIYK
jgi:transitional endoplasmic reticulum ATPase